MPKDLNYNKDVRKHYVRYYGWRTSFKTMVNYIDGLLKKGSRVEKCKYLTFCAVQAIDVFMFEQLKYIYRNNDTKRLENVYYCENEEQSFSIIQRMIGSSDQGFFGDFKKIILLKEEDVIVSNTDDPFDEPENEKDRELLRLFRVKKSLIEKFPFDVINLDLYGNFFPNSEAKFSETLQTYMQILELQKLKNGHSCDRFLMYLTVYTPMLNESRFVKKEVMNAFEGILFQNLVNLEFREGLETAYGHADPKKLEVYIQFILGFTKQVLFKETYNAGWQPKIIDILTYDRRHPADRNNIEHDYKETTFIVEYFRNEELDNKAKWDGQIPDIIEEYYKEQLFSIVVNKPEQVPDEMEIDKEVTENLEKIVNFRNTFLKKLEIYDESLFS